ncbi:uncharacterized protein PV07_04630 [Cladophialophora immunda]|uniref:laccase n=1 Tax=Cladophialophora immunda TaxID=569365 RepID=A0A0D1ZL98_9EURO|nr:uncharacterized protein PV07_04630 [Cladophialophora immunda]KIW28756.1 hypothetical protein PV07_04630 [Cladophialophora immunda]OQV09464.1 hypothetical protein CLAIMM_13584 [Cladophialophora immunda]
MRSFPLFFTAAAAGLASASTWESDVTVTATSTRTHTICPVTQVLTCDASGPTDVGAGNGWHPGHGDNGAEDAWASLWDAQKSKYGIGSDWNTATATGGRPDNGWGNGGHGGHGSTPSTTEGSGPSSTGSGGSGSGPSSSGSGGSGSGPSSSYSYSYTSPTTSGGYVPTSSSTPTTTASSGACPTYTPVKNATDDYCNSASDRSVWCDNKDINSDYYSDYQTGVTRKYTLTITNTTLVFDGTGPKLALAINGQVPGPVIEANWGDMVEVTVINQLQDNSTSIHWHGIRQLNTNDQDGVPGVTECGIAGNGGSRTYTWLASSYGTSWYHSHTFAQYGDGIRGPIVIHGPATSDYDYDMGTVMIDDTFPITAAAMASRIAHVGPGGSFNTLFNGMNKNPDGTAPGGTPFSWGVKPCKKHLFRIINSSAQNSYIVGFDNHTMTVIAADFVPIVPYTTTTLNIATGQRFDVIVQMDQAPSSYYVRAVIQTGCPSGGANSGLGTANAIINYENATPVTPVISTSITNVTANICQDEPLASLVPYLEKPAGTVTAFQGSASTIPAGSVTSVATNDDGTVFQWYINNAVINVNYSQPTLQTLAQGSNNSLISNPVVLSQANQWVYFVIQNQFFASHPMHVHGHDVSILGTGTGTFTSDLVSSLNFDNPMRRDTVMLQGSPGPGFPAGYTVIGFETDNPGAWLMHCHISWHVDGGLALQFLERPDDIPAKQYVDQAFEDECSALAAYQDSNPQGAKLTGQSGLKARGYSDELDIEIFRPDAKIDINKYRKRYSHRRLH